jgi:hypothetical protein
VCVVVRLLLYVSMSCRKSVGTALFRAYLMLETCVCIHEQTGKNPLKFILCSGNKEIYCIYMTCYIIFVLCSTKCCLFHNFILFCSNNIHFSINHVLKLEKPSRYVKGSCMLYFNCLVTNSDIQILAHLLHKM